MRFKKYALLLLSLLPIGCGNPYLAGSGSFPVEWDRVKDSAPIEELPHDLMSLSFDLKEPVREKPFSKALLLQGGGFNTAVHLGIYDALSDRGYRPDLLISSCGGSVAAALIRGIPSRSKRLQMILSPEHEYVRSFRTTGKAGLFSALSLILSLSGQSAGGPDNFTDFLLRTPGPGPLGSLDLSFSEDQSGDRPAILVVAGTVTARDGSTIGARRFTETYFTEPSIALRVHGRKSDIREQFPEARVESSARAIVPLANEAQSAYLASFADPFLFPPVTVGEEDHGTGAINLHPLELARELSSEVALSFPNRFETIVENRAFVQAFGYDANERARAVRSQEADHWIDLTDADAFFSENGLNPRLAGSGRVETGVPAELSEYRWKVQNQYRYGYARAIEGLYDSTPDRLKRIRVAE